MTTPSRTVTVLALIQVAIVFGGFLITRAFVRLVEETGEWALKYFSPISLLTSSYGLCLLIVPITWVLLFSLRSEGAPQNRFGFGTVSIGILITFLLLVFFSSAFLMAVQDATTMRGPLEPMD